ncbi:hypothetical protein GCK72_025341 [Caenorhabditis remanei]|uniref:F-box domain-containing protein n=1 Tax=Caenorhabditis remanei TaxID=31234 RepID=A0A6A5G2M4_CAERE|nr:hypothetical protein GCK72_025341 [Caenorhabditis remanei]KAF1748874.1 hypothetical protein GCK72_025341 [Caenorhabditis remanei]
MLGKLSRILPSIQRACKNLPFRSKNSKKGKKSFPLLSLPSLILEKVFNQTEAIDLLNLTACSKNAGRAVKITSKRNSAKTCLLHLRYPRPSITISFYGFRKNLVWMFDKEEKLTKKHVQEEKTLSGYLFNTYREKKKTRHVMCRNENVREGFIKILDHFLQVFTVPIQIVVEPNLGDLMTLFNHPLLLRCSELELTRGYKQYHFGREELNAICKKIHVKDRFRVDVDTGSTNLRQIFFVENFSICNANWMCSHDLLNLDCRTAKFKRHAFKIDEIEDYALKWLSKPHKPKLERMEFAWDPLEEVWFDKLKTMEWDKTRRSKCCMKSELLTSGTYDCSAAFDFIRKDGLLASIGVVDDVGGSILLFHVWHDRFPTKTQQDLLQKKLAGLYTELPEVNELYGVGSVAERELQNPKLSIERFQELLNETYTHRIALFNSSPELEYWYGFHNQILNVMKDIRFLV